MRAYIIFKDYQDFPEGMEFLRQVADEIVVRQTNNRPNKDELKKLVAEYDIMVVGMKEDMDDEVFEHTTKLKYLCSSSIGTNHISKKFFESDKIKIINVSHANVFSVAEFVLAYIISNIKLFDAGHKAFADGTDRIGMPHLPQELSSMTLGVIGAGKIATKFIELIKPFNPNILCWTPHPDKHQDLSALGAEFVSLEKLFEKSDYIPILIPLTDDTKHLVSKELLSMAKPKAKIINVSRMDVVDNVALKEMVLGGKFHGSLMDALNNEINRDIAEPMLPYIQFMPHVAGVSEEAQVRIFTEIMEKLVKAVEEDQ